MKKSIVFIIVLGVIAILILWGIGQYNGIIKLEEGVNSSWSQVENMYQRRADLIPNLVSTVKGYASHESETLQAVTDARTKATQMNVGELNVKNVQEFQAIQDQLSSSLGRLLAVAESYPDLKASSNFLDLQAQLEGTENRIAEARRQFNNAAEKFNVKIRVFPANIIASMFHFENKGYFVAAEGAETAPKVEF